MLKSIDACLSTTDSFSGGKALTKLYFSTNKYAPHSLYLLIMEKQLNTTLSQDAR